MVKADLGVNPSLSMQLKAVCAAARIYYLEAEC